MTILSSRLGYEWTDFPALSRGHKFIIIVIEYITKWVEVVLLISTKYPKKVVFIEYHIIYWFGIPTHIVIENGK